MAKAKPKAAPRIRRAPEDARQHILDAADAVFARSLPDAVGLRDIAAEAKISHGLITHYFATYENLVIASIARRFAAARVNAGQHLSSLGGDDTPLIAILTDLLADKTLTRLVAWSSMTGQHEQFLSTQNFSTMIDAMEAELVRRKLPVSRESLELGVMLTISTVLGWSIIGGALERAAGRTPLTSEQLRSELRHLTRGYLMVRR